MKKRRVLRKTLAMSVLTLFLVLQSAAVFALPPTPPPPPPPPTVDIDINWCADSPCHPFSLTTCALPYPSDIFTPEEMEATFSDDILSQLPESLFPTNVLKDRDGWSPTTAVLFEAPYEVKACALPVDGGEVLKVFDLEDPGAPPIPVRVRLSQAAEVESRNWEGVPDADTRQVIEAFPRSRFPFGHKLAAVLTTSLAAADGTTPTAAEIPECYDDLVFVLADRGVDPGTILSLTAFTIDTEENTTGKLFEMIDVVENQDHPVRNLRREYPLIGGSIAAILRGEVQLTSFRDPVDGTVQFETGDTGTPYWAEFDLYLPDHAHWTQVPIIIYGHGLAADKESTLILAEINGLAGVATIAIDWPNHGSRGAQDGGLMLDLFAPDTVGYITGMATQGIVDFNSLLAAIRTSLASTDLLPQFQNPLSWLLFPNGCWQPDIDIDKIYYLGTSLGGVFGSAFVGSASNLDGAFLQVSGAGIMRTLSLSNLYEMMEFYKMVPEGATPSETALLFNYVQNIVDVADGANLIHNVRDPNVGGQTTTLVNQYGLYDSIVHNDSSLALAELAGLKQVDPIWIDLPYIPNTSDYNTPYALVQGMFPIPPIDVLGLDLAMAQHGTVVTPSAMVAWGNWLNNIPK